MAGAALGLLLPTAFGDGKIRGQLDELTEQLNSLDSWLSEADQQRSKLLADLREKDRAVAEAAGAVAASDAALGGIEAQLEELRAERNGHLAKQSQEAGRIGGHVAAAYRLRGEGFLRLLLDQRDPTRAERMLVYHRHLINARMEAYKSFRRASAQLRHNAEALAARRIAERAERQRRILRQDELKRNRTERQALIGALEKGIADKQRKRKALLLDQQRLRALIAELQTRALDLDDTGFATRRGSLPWPLEGLVVGRFGEPRTDGRLMWQGLLMKADPGSPVRAVFRGRVVFADWMRGFGNLMILDHGDGYMTLYGHADRMVGQRGDLVESGEVIAHAGQSGGLATSGLYFEIRHNGDVRDPLPWFAERTR